MRIRPAFTMVELIFVIVVLGILAAVAVPRLAATRTDAEIVKGRSTVAAIRSGIALQKSNNLMQGNTGADSSFYPDAINNSATTLFYFNDGNASNILESPIYAKSSDGHWQRNGNDDTSFLFTVSGISVQFDYNATTGIFNCDRTDATSGATCQDLTE